MLKFLKSLINKETSDRQVYDLTEDESFQKELDISPYIKKESHDMVMKHLTRSLDINKTGNKLSVNEKKELGLNSRLSITKELIETLTAQGLAHENPKIILDAIFYNVTFKISRNKKLNSLSSVGVKEIMLLGTNDESDCEWCDSMQDQKVPITTDVNELIKINCKCKRWCRLVIQPVINF